MHWFLTLPLSACLRSRTPSATLKLSNLGFTKAFVNISATWSTVEILLAQFFGPALSLECDDDVLQHTLSAHEKLDLMQA